MRNPTLTLKTFHHRPRTMATSDGQFWRVGHLLARLHPTGGVRWLSGRSASGRCVIFRYYCVLLAGKISGEKVAVDRGQPAAELLFVRMYARLGHICSNVWIPVGFEIQIFIGMCEKVFWNMVWHNFLIIYWKQCWNFSIFSIKTTLEFSINNLN